MSDVTDQTHIHETKALMTANILAALIGRKETMPGANGTEDIAKGFEVERVVAKILTEQIWKTTDTK